MENRRFGRETVVFDDLPVCPRKQQQQPQHHQQQQQQQQHHHREEPIIIEVKPAPQQPQPQPLVEKVDYQQLKRPFIQEITKTVNYFPIERNRELLYEQKLTLIPDDEKCQRCASLKDQ